MAVRVREVDISVKHPTEVQFVDTMEEIDCVETPGNISVNAQATTQNLNFIMKGNFG